MKTKQERPIRYACPSCPHDMPNPGNCDVCGRRLVPDR